MEDLTDKQREILSVIRSNFETRGHAPTVRQIGRSVGLSSSCSVKKHLDVLETKGYVHREPYQRDISLMEGGAPLTMGRSICVPLLGTVRGGPLTLAAQDPDAEMLPLPVSLLPKGTDMSHELFALKVRGDSMRDAGITNGDIVVARKQPTARDGEIVIAMVEDEATVKTFYKEKNRFRLQPENPEFEPIYIDDVSILGRVTLAIKQF